MRVLIVEDDPLLADGLTRSLRQADFAVDCVSDGERADHVLAAQHYDLVILDLGLPKLDGFEVLKRLRRRGATVPVLVLTARDALADRVKGLDLGADDYLTKPFDLPELEARARALIRRGQSGGSSLLTHGPLTLDTSGRRATLAGATLELSARELGVLEVLMLRSGRVVNKDQLAEQLYSWDDEVGSNAIEVYVHRLRKKLEPAGVAIRTIRGLGYLLEKDMKAIANQQPPMYQPETATLRHQLLISLLAPIILVTLVSSVITYYYAFNFATLAYDYALFDSALDISRQAHVNEGHLRIDLPRAAIDMLESDKHDRIYYAVTDSKGAFVSGYHGLPLPPEQAPPGKPVYYDGSYRGDPVRIAALYSTVTDDASHDPILILVGETLNKRHTLANEILLGMLWPELLLILLVGLLVWYGVERGLKPLALLQTEISNRSHRDLSPLPEQNAPGEVRSLIRAMNGLLARLASALSSHQRFIADAAHQLRTPLAGLKTQTELALRQKDFDAVRHTLQQLNTATEHTTHLVNQLLSLARAEPGVDRAQAMQPVNLFDIARDTTTEWVPRALARNIDLGFDGAAGAVTIDGDALLIREMLGNLLDNAIRYTPPKGQVTVSVAAERGKVLLSVEDSGPGIPSADRERVFERFHRILGTGTEGCGLGLAIVREIAQSHNADTRLGPRARGDGTLVTVVFPQAA